MHWRLISRLLVSLLFLSAPRAFAANAYISAFPTSSSVSSTDTFPDCVANGCNSGTSTKSVTAPILSGGMGVNPCSAIALTDASTVSVNAGSTCYIYTLTMTSGVGSTRALGNPTGTTVGEWLEFLITQPASGGPYSLTFGGDYLNAASSGYVVSLNTGASAVTKIDCQVVSATPTLYCYGPIAPYFNQTTFTSPTNPSSISAYLMQGLAGICAPVSSGIVDLVFAGTVVQTAGTSATIGVQWQLSYGTGTAPTSNTTLTGTQVGPIWVGQQGSTVTANDPHQPFTVSYTLALTPGTTYWVDVAAESVGTASDTGFRNGYIGCKERY